jgi:hypothetical protein
MAHPSADLVCPAAAMNTLPYQTPVTAGNLPPPPAQRGMTRREYGSALFMFLLSPLLPAIAATLKFGSKYAVWIWVFFIGIFGYHMIFDSTSDGAKHTRTLGLYEEKTFPVFVADAASILLLRPVELERGTTQDDLFLHVLMYFVSRLSSSKEVLFLFVGLIYGYFYVSSVQRIHALMAPRWNILLMTLFVLFVFWSGVDGLSNMRFPLGMWVLFYGALRYYESGQHRYFILACLAPLIHVGHILSVLPLLAIRVVGIRPLIFVGVLAASFLFTILDVEMVTRWASMTEVGQEKARHYVSEEVSVGYFAARGRTSFHARWQLAAGKLIFTVLLFYALATSGYMQRRLPPLLSHLCSMGILLLSISNIATFSIAVNRRLGIAAGLFILAFLTLYYAQLRQAAIGTRTQRDYFEVLVFLLMPAIALFLFTQFSMIGDFMDLRTILSPAFYPFLDEGPISIKEFIRNVIS